VTLSRAIRNIAAWWSRRCAEKRLERADPRLRILRLREQDARRRHKAVRSIREERSRIIHEMLGRRA